jgi:RNA polymerase sigma-70 factor (ECF subfamily)
MGGRGRQTFHQIHSRSIERLYRKADATRWQVSMERFRRALETSAVKRFGVDGPAAEVTAYLESLHVADLALAAACIDGHEAAWEHFVRCYRPELYAAARATGNESAREIADALYAELFGLEVREGRRRSLFEYFHGRSKLSTWLRSVFAQRFVDAIRAGRRTAPLDEVIDGVGSDRPNTRPPHEPDPARARYLLLLRTALERVLGSLDSRDRLRLSCYYVQNLTLAQIGRMTGEHEATVSRKLERTRRDVRRGVDAALAGEGGLQQPQIDLCYQYALEDWPYDLSRALARADEP